MAAKKSKFSVYTLSAIGVMTAVSFISNFISIPIGTLTRIHMGNVFCSLSGILLGPFYGGLAGGLGAFFYDFTNPLYVAEAPITLFNKFFIGFLAGLISHRGGHYGEKASLNFVGALAGNLAYTALFYLKNFISEYFLLHLEMNTIMANLMVRPDHIGSADPADPDRHHASGPHLPQGDPEGRNPQKTVPRTCRRQFCCIGPNRVNETEALEQ